MPSLAEFRASADSDTIVALATPPGRGAVAIVRLSGPAARAIAAQLAPCKKPRRSHQLAYVTLRSQDGALLDKGMVAEMHQPHSYTGEDVVEFFLHGSPLLTRSVQEACIAAGARAAQPGEFTLRAYLNGRLDLPQAEAVATLIDAESQEAAQGALRALAGGLSALCLDCLAQLEPPIAELRGLLDFPDDVAGAAPLAALRSTTSTLRQRLQSLCASEAHSAAQGRSVALGGPPNAGKSTLLNAWLGEERVLVDAQPGTTRDVVEVALPGVGPTPSLGFALFDTAGFRAQAPHLEAQGIAHSERYWQRAALVLWLANPDVPMLPPESLRGRPLWVVCSQSDRFSAAAIAAFQTQIEQAGFTYKGSFSARSGAHLEILRQQIQGHFNQHPAQQGGYSFSPRQRAALQAASAALTRAEALLTEPTCAYDLLLLDLEEAARALAELVGRDVDAALLDAVFARFCIGK